MHFSVSNDLFDKLPTACFGAVAVRGLDNTQSFAALQTALQQEIGVCEAHFEGVSVKQSSDIRPYREAFRTLDINPNKFLCSIEALLTRIAKKKGFPSINSAVDLGNLISIRHHLPIGAHDLGTVREGLEVRAAREGDVFVPFGGEGTEIPEPGEIVYVSDQQVRTRRWTWRQSEIGKITDQTSAILYPIDGFTDLNLDQVLEAMEDFKTLLPQFFSCEIACQLIDKDHPRFDFF